MHWNFEKRDVNAMNYVDLCGGCRYTMTLEKIYKVGSAEKVICAYATKFRTADV